MQSEHSVVTKVFRRTMTASMLDRLASSVGVLTDGIVIGSFLGVNALAAYGLVAPLTMIYFLCGNSLSGGTRNLYTKLAGQGHLDQANNAFTLGLTVSLTMSISLAVLTYFFLSPLAALLGASGENSALLPLICQYLGGFAIGVAFEQAGKFLAAFMGIDSDHERVLYATITFSVLSVAGDLAVVLLFNGNMLLLGLSASLSRIGYFFVLALHFLRKDRMLRITLKGITDIKHKLAAILFNSAPSVIIYVSNALGGIAIYRILSEAASIAYIAAFSVYKSVEKLIQINYLGIADTTWTMSSIYYGEEDRTALNTLQTTALAHIIIPTGAAVVLASFSERAASIYVGHSGDPQALALAAEAVRVYAFTVPLYSLVVLFERYLMGTGKIKTANVYCFLIECGAIVPSVYMMVKLLGGRGVWFAFPVMLSIMTAFALACIHFWKVGDTFNTKRLLLGSEFGVDSGKEVSISADSVLEVMGMSHLAGLFCLENGIDKRKANVLSLCIEELGMNIINHGFSDGKKHSIDMRILVKNDELILRMRDDCRPFNPVERYKMTIEQEEDKSKNIGIRMVMKMSRDVQYLSTMETNNLIIRI